MFLGMLLATTAFTVLTGAADTSRLVVRGEVAKNFRPAYDILVRPQGAVTGMEKAQGLVRESYLSGQSGGITLAQYRRIAALDGVDVAAPAAIIGYAMQIVQVPIDLSRYAGASGSGPRVLRLDVVRDVDSGLTKVPGERTVFIYVTDDKLTVVQPQADGSVEFSGNEYGPTQRVNGRTVTLCPWDATELAASANQGVANGPFAQARRTSFDCWQRDTVGVLHGRIRPEQTKVVTARIPLSLPYLVAAIDPEAEARLVGLDRSVIDGRYLERAESWHPAPGIAPGIEDKQVPILMASRTFASGSDDITISDLGAPGVAAMTAGLKSAPLRTSLLALDGTPTGTTSISAQQAFDQLPGIQSPGTRTDEVYDYFGDLWSAGPPQLAAAGPRAVKVLPRAENPKSLDYASFSQVFQPLAESQDVPFRDLTHYAGDSQSQTGEKYFKVPRWQVVGRFDPTKVSQGSDLASVPLSLYAPSSLTGADAASKAALKDGQLAPNGSMLGYAQEPPMMLTTIDAMSAFTAPGAYPTMAKAAAAPLGSIRVRVKGVVGVDALSRERVRKVAQEITDDTGLAVDVVVGSSPTPVTVGLPAGKYGRPALNLEEGWVLKGVGVALLQAVDRKSIALFALILAVCSLFMVNAASAAVRARRTELGVLACLGWSRRQLFRSILGELALIGLAAGAAGALLSWPISALAGLQVSPWRALAAIPAAVVLAVLAGILPARAAAQAHPGAAVRPAVFAPRRATSLRTLPGLAFNNLRRVPGRALVGVLSLAIGMCALTVLVAITRAFNGAAVGSLLGDAITLQVRGVDYFAVAATILLGGLATADVLYLNVRERAGEFAALRAMGWPERSLTRLVSWEGLAIGGTGAVLGALVGVGLTAWFTSQVGSATWVAGAIAAVTGIVVTLLALTVPTAALRRLPTAAVLAEEE